MRLVSSHRSYCGSPVPLVCMTGSSAPWPSGCGGDSYPPNPSGTSSGQTMPPFSRISAYSRSICSRSQSMPRSRNTNFRRALLRFWRLPYLLNTRTTASQRLSRRSSGRNSSSSWASVGRGPRPPPITTRKPRRPSRTTARRLISLMAPAMQSFARQIAGEVLAQKCVGDSLGVGPHVEDLVAAEARQRAGGDVAHSVVAGFAIGESGVGQQVHDVGHLRQRHEVILHVLAGGDVALAAGEGLAD